MTPSQLIPLYPPLYKSTHDSQETQYWDDSKDLASCRFVNYKLKKEV